MPANHRAADAAKRLLRTASRHLMTPDPTTDPVVTQSLDRSLDWQVDDRGLRSAASRSFEPNFSETAGRSLAFQVKPTGRGLSLSDQREIANGAVRGLIHEHRSEEHTSELQSPCNLVCRLLLEKKKTIRSGAAT